MSINLRCSDEKCVNNIQYTDSAYIIFAVFRGTIIGRISSLSIDSRANCFAKMDDGRYGCLPYDDANHENVHTTGTITFSEYDFNMHLQKAVERNRDEKPVKFDVVITWGDKIVVVTGVRPAINNMRHLRPDKTYNFIGNEEYHACNHCEEAKNLEQ